MIQASSSLQTSAFSQYKGELVISLKYITNKKRTPEKKSKGEKNRQKREQKIWLKKKQEKAINMFDCLSRTFLTICVSVSGKKPEIETGELHVLIKEAKSLTPMKTGDISDSFVKGWDNEAVTKTPKHLQMSP